MTTARNPTARLPRPATDPVLKVMRPLVEAYWAFVLEDARHARLLGLTSSQFDVIATLGNTEGMTCSEISRSTLVTKGTLTGVLDRLEARGLVGRTTVPEDRRSLEVSLTPKGEALFRKAFPAQIDHLKPFFERALTPSDATRLRDLLLRLRDSFRGSVGIRSAKRLMERCLFFEHVVLTRTIRGETKFLLAASRR